MAEISSSIYQFLDPRRVTPLDPLGHFQQAQQTQQQSAFGQLALQEARRQRQAEEAVRAQLQQRYREMGTAPASGMGAPGMSPQPGAVQETVNTPYSSALQGMLSQYQQEGADVTPTPGPRVLPGGGMPLGGAPAQPQAPAPAQSPMARQSQDVLTPEVIRQVGMIDPALAMKLEQDSFKRQGDRLKMLEDQNTMVAQVARGILQLDTQPGYEQGVAVLRRMGIPVDHLPAQYDRRMVEGYEAMLTDAATRLQDAQAQHQRAQAELAPQQEARLQRQYELDVRREDRGITAEERQQRMAEETARHNRALEDKSGTAEERQQRQATEAERHNRRMEELQGTSAERAQTQQQAAQENTLRDEFDAKSKDYRAQSDAYGRIEVSAQDPSAAGDLALIFSYMKILDPGSTVREGEQATAANARGVPEAIASQYNRVMRGEKLGETQRKDFVDRAQRLYDQATRDHQHLKTQTEERARRYGVKPENVTTAFGSTARKTLSEQMITDTIADSQKPGSTPVTRQQVIDAARAKGYQVP